jgi:hypothetical protein
MWPVPDAAGADGAFLKLCRATQAGNPSLELKAYDELEALASRGSSQHAFWQKAAADFRAGMQRVREHERQKQEAAERAVAARRQPRGEPEPTWARPVDSVAPPAFPPPPGRVQAGLPAATAGSSRPDEAFAASSMPPPHSAACAAGHASAASAVPFAHTSAPNAASATMPLATPFPPPAAATAADAILAPVPLAPPAAVSKPPAAEVTPSQEASSARAHALEEDYQCTVCLDLLFEPSTTSCGHTFCRPCLLRATAANPSCPLCRKNLGLIVPSINALLCVARMRSRLPSHVVSTKPAPTRPRRPSLPSAPVRAALRPCTQRRRAIPPTHDPPLYNTQRLGHS